MATVPPSSLGLWCPDEHLLPADSVIAPEQILNKTAPEHQGQTAGDGSPAWLWLCWLCCAGVHPLLKMWNVHILGYWVFSVTWENWFLITVKYFLQVNLEVLAALRIMKSSTFLFQILTFKTKSIWSYPQHWGKEECGKVGAALGLFPSKTAAGELKALWGAASCSCCTAFWY